MIQNQIPTVALIIPIYNAEQDIPKLFHAIRQQTLKPDHILVINSSSTDPSTKILNKLPIDIHIHTIKQSDFDHGGTRKLATKIVDADIYLYLTQDAIPANPNSFKNLIDVLLTEEKIACAYGRQLPKSDATPLSAHARLFNYPMADQIRSYQDKRIYGIKTCFNSDSFAAYKKKPLIEIDNFPEHLITGEDVYVAAKLLKKGYSIAYAANAAVFHSHNLSLRGEFHRYFSIGVFHGREKWILEDFNSATGEGFRFVKAEINYLLKIKKLHWLPKALMSTLVKYAAYQLGLREKMIPHIIKKKLGINKSFWVNAKAKLPQTHPPPNEFTRSVKKENIANTKINDSNITVLILMSTYNGERFLAAQIDSIISQTFVNWTLMIRDDGSTDKTVDIIKKYCQTDPRLVYLDDKLGNLGISKSFSALMLKAALRQEPFVFFCDQDDFWLPHKLSRQILVLNELECKYGQDTPILVHSDLCVVDSNLKVIHPSFLGFEKLNRNTQSPLKTLLINNFITGCTVGMNKKLLDIANPIPENAFIHDWWCALCAATAGQIGFVDEATLLYRQHMHNSIGSKGFYRKIRELLNLKTNFVKRQRNMRRCFGQAESLLACKTLIAQGDKNNNVTLIKRFVSLTNKNFFTRYFIAKNLMLKPASKIRALVFWLFLGFV